MRLPPLREPVPLVATTETVLSRHRGVRAGWHYDSATWPRNPHARSASQATELCFDPEHEELIVFLSFSNWARTNMTKLPEFTLVPGGEVDAKDPATAMFDKSRLLSLFLTSGQGGSFSCASRANVIQAWGMVKDTGLSEAHRTLGKAMLWEIGEAYHLAPGDCRLVFGFDKPDDAKLVEIASKSTWEHVPSGERTRPDSKSESLHSAVTQSVAKEVAVDSAGPESDAVET